MSDQLIRETPSKYLMRLLGCLSLLSLTLLPTSGIGYTDRIVAVVNKEVITWFDLQNEIQDEYSRLKAKYRGEELERRYRLKQREVLNALIVEHLQLQEAKAKGISVTQEEIDAAIRRTPL
ncbi:MAG: SurA N-terminal domain-containing protein, partial [Nitrospirota bacterium]|nr:SurA N-terminal domain-containing protein [Nitrospirota bacterium]MDX2419985.1 SurA N-terminal domain-containing protein [Nitrospirota bacterium]